MTRFRDFSHSFLKGVAVLVIGHLLVALGMAASPGLHETLHHDADHAPQHECAATLLANGSCDFTAPVALCPLPRLGEFSPQIFASRPNPEPLALYGPCRGRAPPVVS